MHRMEAKEMPISDILRERLLQAYRELQVEGKLPSRAQLATYRETFRRRFGPEALRDLDGERLLETMHAHTTQDSLVYWLEFKNDEEFPDVFGSIAGGSALKFGIYRSRETGAWMTGSPQAQRELSLEEAITYARRHRDQLGRGVELLEALPVNRNDEVYRALQENMDRLAPAVGNTAWGHKYFTMGGIPFAPVTTTYSVCDPSWDLDPCA